MSRPGRRTAAVKKSRQRKKGWVGRESIRAITDDAKSTPLIVSVGYERRTIENLVEVLAHKHVGKLLDVREAPMSRRKDFNKKALQATLEEAGIEYRHLRTAGNPHRKETTDVERCLRLYQDYLSRHPEVLDIVAEELNDGPVAFLCYERLHGSCHRSVLLRSLSERGHRLHVVRVE